MSDFIIVNGELYHHGIKGMKWGHRKSRKQMREDVNQRLEESRRQIKESQQLASKGFTYPGRSVSARALKSEQLATKMRESGRAHTAYSLKAAEKEGRKIRDKEDWRSYSRDLYKRDPEYKKLYDQYETDLRAYRAFLTLDYEKRT